MNNRILLEILEDKRVQKLLEMSFLLQGGDCCVSYDEMYEKLKGKLKPRNRAKKSNWTQQNLGL